MLYAYLTCGNYDCKTCTLNVLSPPARHNHISSTYPCLFVLIFPVNYDRAKNLRPKRNIKTAMQHEIMMYGCAQKEVMGLDVRHRLCHSFYPMHTRAPLLTNVLAFVLQKAVEECKYRMSRYGVTPNVRQTSTLTCRTRALRVQHCSSLLLGFAVRRCS